MARFPLFAARTTAESNPWLTLATDAEPESEKVVVEQPARLLRVAPHPAIAPLEESRRLQRRTLDPGECGVALWVLGAHGGAGEDAIAALLPDARAAAHAWPLAPAGHAPARVALLARTTYAGLRAALAALTDWMSGSVPVEVVCVITSADAPGRLPGPLATLLALLQDAAPGERHHVAYQPAWRLGQPGPHDLAIARDLCQLIAPNQEE